MTWEQKLHALDMLAGAAKIGMREPGNWFCSHRLDIKDKYMLIGGCGNGPTVEEAVLDQWERVTTKLADHQYIVISRENAPRRSVRWNGYMWADVPADELQAATT